jgi:hypothetical protein
MTALEAMAKAISGVDLKKPGWNEEAARAALLVLAEFRLPSLAFFKAGLALGELYKESPSARGGDALAVQWKAVLLMLADERNSDSENPAGSPGAALPQ